MWQFDTEISEIIERAPGVKSFRFPVAGKKASYRPGQFFFVTIMIDGRKAVHHFSFSSSPTDAGYLEFTKRITGHPFSRALDTIQPGTSAHVQGPQGDFVLPEKPRRIAFLTGGIGITPVRSMLRFMLHEGLKHDVILLYGNQSPEQISFRDELDQTAAGSPTISVEHIIASPTAGWPGRTGMINKDLIVEQVPDYKERLFYVSGPPSMVMNLVEQLAALKVPQTNIYRDSFTGYD